jgi:CheY-like chemotaxis protein
VRILLVEDSKPIRRANESALHKAGYEVICAEDGESALHLAREHHPDLILLDMILPKMSGPEVLQQLKNDSVTAGIPVVVLSSLTEKNRQKLMEAGSRGVHREKLADASARNEPAAQDAGKHHLPHQPQTRDPILQRSRAGVTLS